MSHEMPVAIMIGLILSCIGLFTLLSVIASAIQHKSGPATLTPLKLGGLIVVAFSVGSSLVARFGYYLGWF